MSEIKLDIDSKLENVKLVGMAVNRLCCLGLSQAGCDEVELAVVEAVNNCIRHAYHKKSGHSVEVKFKIGTQDILIEIRDSGSPIDPRLKTELGAAFSFNPEDIDALPEGSMGWYLIKHLMDDVSYVSSVGMNTLKLTKKLPAHRRTKEP
ncbi:MAG: ATP-binding protein [Gallionella sp.]